MPYLGAVSDARLRTCHPDLQRVVRVAIESGPDFSVLCGHRDRAAQEAAYESGHSNAEWADSMHNRVPSLAVDLAPYPIDWDDLERFRALAHYVLGVAAGLGVSLRWGGDWDRDYESADERFIDMPHFELTA